MPGLRQHLVTEIARTLRDRYHNGFPILKELVQNADDAKASRIIFGHHPGSKQSTAHPLLTGPALWVFNDGNFKKSDATAIEYFGINTKAGDDTAIGKFGLGMKSVFHLCEAFFYVAYDGVEIHKRILNPWYSDVEEEGFHNKWESVHTSDWDMLTEIGLQHAGSESSSWFLMWIPLRKHTHTLDDFGQKVGAIVDRFPGDADSIELEFLKEHDLERSLAFVLPLLKHLKSIKYLGNEKFPSFLAQIECQDGTRLDHQTPELRISGQVTGAKTSEFLIQFNGHQTCPDTNAPAGLVFEQLRTLNAWPKSFRLNEQRQFEQVRDKSRAEASVVLQVIEGDVGRISLDWAVFLPIEEGVTSYTAPIIGSSRHFRFVLHGQFFVDAGRRGINGYSSLAESQPHVMNDLDEAGLAVRWNQYVAQKLVLPNLLKVMADFAVQARLSDSELTALTEALQYAQSKTGQSFYQKYRHYICQELSWACVMSTEGRAWKLFQTTSAQRLLPLPKAPNDDPQRPWSILPGLRNLKDTIFYDASKPRLALTSNIWDEDSLISALTMTTDADLIKAFATQTGLDYLASFLAIEEKRYVAVSSIQDKLFNLIRRALRLIPLDEIRRHSARFRAVLKFLERKRLTSIGTGDPTAINAVPANVFRALFSIESTILLLPRDLAPDDTESVRTIPSDLDISAWLKCIDELVISDTNGISTERCLVTADYIIKLCPNEDDRVSILLSNRNLRVLKAICPLTTKTIASSLNTLLSLHKRGNVFLYSGQLHDKLGLAPTLAHAIPNEQLVVIDTASGKLLRDSGAGELLRSSSPSDVLRSIGSQQNAKILGGECERLTLIKRTFQCIQDIDARRGLRYLLHGVPEKFHDMESPLWIGPGKSNSPWIKTWKIIEGEKWNVLPPSIANSIPPSEWEDIGLKSVDSTEVITRLLQINDLSVIDPFEFSSSERDAILGAINDQTLWCSIPLHRFIDGQFSSVSPKTFLQSNRSVPNELEACCRIIEESDDPNHASKQHRFLRRFDSIALIDTALQLPHPATAWSLILEELSNIDESKLDKFLLSKLASIPWIPLHNGGTIKAADVIDVPALADDIDRLATKAGYCFSGIGALDERFRAHHGYPSANKLFSNGVDAAKQIGLLIAEVNEYHVGNIRSLEEQELKELMPALVALELPGWRIINSCSEIFGHDVVCSEILPNVLTTIPIMRVSSALNALLAEQSNSNSSIKTFCKYLALYPSYPRNDALHELKKLKLLTKAGNWRVSTELCCGSIGLDSSHVLDSTFAKILGELLVHVGSHGQNDTPSELEQPKFEEMVIAAPQVMRDYFAPWESHVRPEVVGAFMALFGKQLRDQAEKWLQPHSADWLFDNIGWQVPSFRSDGTGEWMKGNSASQAFSLLKVGVSIIQGEKLDVPSIFGHAITVPLANTIENLVAGGFYWKGGYSVEVRIRQIPDITARSSSELSEILKKSATYILQHAYSQRNADITALWGKLQESDQLDLSVARSLILEHLPFVLRDQIGAQKRNHDLAQALKAYDKIRRAKTEAELSTNLRTDHSPDFDLATKCSLNALATLLIDRADVQEGVLSAVRDKLRDFQYDISGILFELFQNADDAVVELEKLNRDLHGESFIKDEELPFVVDVSNDAIRTIHWGRPINYCPPAIDDGRADDFRRDLEKMLILSSSDKSQESGVTGKFGLGFKSVLLATESPKVLSGDLRFEIVGGVLPMPWKSTDEAVKVLKTHSGASRLKATLTELPVSDSGDRSRILERFNLLCSLQSIFGRSIREIRIVGTTKPVPRGRWKAKTTIGKFELGSCDMPTANGWCETRLLVFRGESGCIVLRLNSRGIERVDRHTPPFWVTAPTRESEPIGFLVNGGFEVDAGRSRLASDSTFNQKLAKKLGKQFGVELAILYQNHEEEWQSIRQSLALADDVQQADYWASIWRAIYPRTEDTEAEVHRLARIIATEAILELVRKCQKIPNGLKGSLSTFVMRTSSLVALPSGWRSEEVLSQLSSWQLFQKNYPHSQWIADDLATIVNDIYSLDIKKLTIKNLIACIENGQCDAEAAICLQLVATKLLENLTWIEAYEARATFASLKFRSQVGSWSSASSLLTERNGSPDEQLIVGFAPKGCLLSKEYSDQAISFFIQCQNKQEVSARDLAEYVLIADNDHNRRAALTYLAKGQHARCIAILLRDRIAGSWLENIDEHKKLLSDLPNEDWLEIVLRLQPKSITYQEGAFSEDDQLDEISSQEKLQCIAQWWETEGRIKHKDRYEERFWPANVTRDFSIDPIDRRAWMTLFGLGLTQRMGRVKDSQHRGFIESLDSQGWWNVFCNIKPHEDGGSREWFKILEAYGEKQIDNEEFGLWMDNFARLYRIARWLDVYVHVFRTIDQRAGNQFGALLNPGADPIFQGDDETAAPSVERSLKNGQHLVIRELLREGVLKSEHAERRAFIPSLSIRQFFTGLGFEEPLSSEDIYEILSEALVDPTFGGDFDIPLRIVAHENLLEFILRGRSE